MSGFNDINMVIPSDSGLSRIFTTGLLSPKELSDHEAVQLSFMFSSFINQYNRLLVLHKKGTFPQARWDTYAKEFAALLATPGGALWKDGLGEEGKLDIKLAIDS